MGHLGPQLSGRIVIDSHLGHGVPELIDAGFGDPRRSWRFTLELRRCRGRHRWVENPIVSVSEPTPNSDPRLASVSWITEFLSKWRAATIHYVAEESRANGGADGSELAV